MEEIRKPLLSQDTHRILVEFKESGGTQQMAIEILDGILSEIRAAEVDELVDDFLLETMDIAVGWCASSLKVWPGSFEP